MRRDAAFGCYAAGLLARIVDGIGIIRRAKHDYVTQISCLWRILEFSELDITNTWV